MATSWGDDSNDGDVHGECAKLAGKWLAFGIVGSDGFGSSSVIVRRKRRVVPYSPVASRYGSGSQAWDRLVAHPRERRVSGGRLRRRRPPYTMLCATGQHVLPTAGQRRRAGRVGARLWACARGPRFRLKRQHPAQLLRGGSAPSAGTTLSRQPRARGGRAPWSSTRSPWPRRALE